MGSLLRLYVCVRGSSHIPYGGSPPQKILCLCSSSLLLPCFCGYESVLHNPVHIQPFLESSCLLGIHIGTSAIGRTAASQRRMEGFQMIGMHIGSGHRPGGIGMLWIGRWIFWPFGASLMPLRPFIPTTRVLAHF